MVAASSGKESFPPSGPLATPFSPHGRELQPGSLTGCSTHSAPGCTWVSFIGGWGPGGDLFHVPPGPRSRVNPCVLRPLTRGPQGQPSPLQTPHGRPGVQGIFPASRGQASHGWPMVHHPMATGFPIPQGCCWALSVSHPIPCFPLPLPAFLGFPIPRGCCAAPFHPSSRVYTPPSRQQPCRAGPLDPHPSGHRFVRLAQVAPFPPPPLSPMPPLVTDLGLFPASHAFPVSWGRRVALATRPCLSRPLFFACRFFLFFNPPGRQQPSGAGPLDPHPSGHRFVRLAQVAPFPPPPLSPMPPPVTDLGLFPASHAFPVSWGRRVALATRPCLSRPLFFACRFFLFFNRPGRQQPSGAGPLDPHSSRDRFLCVVLVAPFPPHSACVVCPLQNLWWVLLPGPRAPRYLFLSPTRSPVAVVFVLCCFLFVFFSRNPRSLFCPFALPRSPAARSLCASRPPEALCGFVRVFVFFSPCILPCGAFLPACTHNNTAQVISHGSFRCPFSVKSPSCGMALGGRRPSQVGPTPSRPTHVSH